MTRSLQMEEPKNLKAKVLSVIEDKRRNFIPKMYHWIAKETWEKYGTKLRNFTSDYHDDFIIFFYGSPTGNIYKEKRQDEWGIERKRTASGLRSQNFPLGD